jgi:nitrogen fixation NifU-like protein
MDDLYRSYILERYKHPHMAGELDPFDVKYADSNPLCGDEISMTLRVEDGRVTDVRFRGRGCAISQASADILTENIRGKTLDELRKVTPDAVIEDLGVEVSPARRKCALLGLKVMQGGLFGLRAWPDAKDGAPSNSDLTSR